MTLISNTNQIGLTQYTLNITSDTQRSVTIHTEGNFTYDNALDQYIKDVYDYIDNYDCRASILVGIQKDDFVDFCTKAYIRNIDFKNIANLIDSNINFCDINERYLLEIWQCDFDALPCKSTLKEFSKELKEYISNTYDYINEFNNFYPDNVEMMRTYNKYQKDDFVNFCTNAYSRNVFFEDTAYLLNLGLEYCLNKKRYVLSPNKAEFEALPCQSIYE